MRTLCAVTYQNMTIVATQARQHHRHSELMLYSDWYWSQVQKPTPKSVPALKVSQYQRGKRGTGEQAHADADDDARRRPARSSGSGAPKAAAWSLFMMLPQETIGLRLHAGLEALGPPAA